MPFSCVLQFAPDSASFVLSFALVVPSRSIPLPSSPTYPFSSQCRRNRPLLPESPQLALHKVCTRLLIITLNGSMARTGMPVSPESLARISSSRLPSCWGSDWACMHLYRLLFSNLFFGRIVSPEMYAGLVFSAAQSHAPSFFLFTLYSILLVDEILMVEILFFFKTQDQILHRARLLPRHPSVNAKGMPAVNQFPPSKARITVKQVPQRPQPRFIRGVPPLHWLPKPSRVRSAGLLPLCTTVLVEMVARIK